MITSSLRAAALVLTLSAVLGAASGPGQPCLEPLRTLGMGLDWMRADLEKQRAEVLRLIKLLDVEANRTTQFAAPETSTRASFYRTTAKSYRPEATTRSVRFRATTRVPPRLMTPRPRNSPTPRQSMPRGTYDPITPRLTTPLGTYAEITSRPHYPDLPQLPYPRPGGSQYHYSQQYEGSGSSSGGYSDDEDMVYRSGGGSGNSYPEVGYTTAKSVVATTERVRETSPSEEEATIRLSGFLGVIASMFSTTERPQARNRSESLPDVPFFFGDEVSTEIEASPGMAELDSVYVEQPEYFSFSDINLLDDGWEDQVVSMDEKNSTYRHENNTSYNHSTYRHENNTSYNHSYYRHENNTSYKY